ncbi:hypothetical protein G9C98_001462 [Cotesia typhae]|uniref:Uncharacterized protein n=1 Tax=Cotesia typhae TaxID=2053667 RepID=A0A8J5UXI2_9HYME|nr:hypothetical protein G9C98_001462 [Cotesia typhae]
MTKLEAKICLALFIITLMSSVVYSKCYTAGQWCYEDGSDKCCPDGYNEKIAPNQRPTYRCVHMHYRYGYPKDMITCRNSNLRKFVYNLSFNSSNDSLILDPPKDSQISNSSNDFQSDYASSSDNIPFKNSDKISRF